MTDLTQFVKISADDTDINIYVSKATYKWMQEGNTIANDICNDICNEVLSKDPHRIKGCEGNDELD